MGNRFMTRAVFGALTVAAMLLAGTAQAALQNRDLNGDGQTDAFYDTDLNITWLRDANVNGTKSFTVASSWASTYSFGGYSDWRLPTSDACNGFNCKGGEMGHLWYVELGNEAPGPMKNFGGFENVQPSFYWSSTPLLDGYWMFGFHVGLQGYSPDFQPNYALAVRDGDVMTSVPEPETYALMLGGLAALALAIRKRRR